MTSPVPISTADRDQEALRIQAAALAAQHAELFEREARVAAREAALSLQEQQLAAHLESKQQRLQELHEQLGQARGELRRERDELERRQAETDHLHGEALEQRDRLRSLHGRFVLRFRRHWLAERTQWESKQSELSDLAARITCEAAALHRERDAFERFRQRFHADAELEKHRLYEERQLLTAEQEEFQAQQHEAKSQLADDRGRLDEQRRTIVSGERRAQAERSELERQCAALRLELQGLETRINNARHRLVEYAAVPATLPPGPAVAGTDLLTQLPPLPAELEAAFAARDEFQRRRQETLEKQSAELTDQRLHLAELYERLAQAEDQWHARQAAAAAEMETLALQLHEQDEQLQARARSIEQAGTRVRQEREAVQYQRLELGRGLAEFHARQIMWQGERSRFQVEIAEREKLTERREQALAELFRRWRERRAREIKQLRELTHSGLELHRQWTEQRDEYQGRTAALREAQAALAEQALALETARQEFLQQSGRPQQAAGRLAGLHRRIEGRFAAAERDLAKRREQLDAEESRHAESFAKLQAMTVQNASHERQLADEHSGMEKSQFELARERAQFDEAYARWQLQERGYQSQLAELRGEIERIARLLIDDTGPDVLSAAA